MFRPLVIAATFACFSFETAWPALAGPPIECIATGSTAGKLSDRSNLAGKLEDGTPANRLGAWGSAIAYTGRDDLYVVLPDRGPNGSDYNPAIDNTTSYPARVQTFRIAVDAHAHTVNVKPIKTLLLTNEEGVVLRGLSTDFVAGRASDFPGNRRIDPEGLRISSDRRHYYVSDEYGPGVFQFDTASGRRTRIFSLPERFAVTRPAATGAAELAGNVSGRQANHGLEGLAITPDGRMLAVILQAPLLQDTAVDKEGRRIGVNVRLATIEIESGQAHQYVYQLTDAKQTGVNEILAVNDHAFLVLERDAKAAAKATAKSVFLIDLDGATDVSHVAALPPAAVPDGIQPVAKRLFLDLLDRQYGLAGARLPAKIEGLTFGPDLADGRHLLLVSSDNDFHVTEPSRLFAFAIDPAALPDYQPQRFIAPCARQATLSTWVRREKDGAMDCLTPVHRERPGGYHRGMNRERLEQLARQLLAGRLELSDFLEEAAQPATADLDEAQIDLDRRRRCGYPEVVYGQGKTVGTLERIFQTLLASGSDVLATRVSPDQAAHLQTRFPTAHYNATGRTLRIAAENRPAEAGPAGHVALVTAGTSDLPVAEEARETLLWMGATVTAVQDVGVAGPHRLREHLGVLEWVDAIVVVAGMEGALPSVVGGYVACPVIAVPTSVGYGANLGGFSALLSMLNSCAANVSVVNIDAGFKGGYVAGLIAQSAARRRGTAG